ncbi:hypothetical protein PLEOSDRAFT_1031053 [Pleurotus ostreatus PC15]|uniref:Uncharacterized protein n=1 Tax=Pleurotus ostreatus (strain PC15) TaxID=1137138 RepID=A0A067P372_PLEO1|nr:hypothetical protein PLEOSDRAFT_1031053 [Pleurotus ostreatus PC15]
MAHEMKHALYLCKKLTALHEVSSPRLWHPHFSWAWLGAAPSTFIMEERGAILDQDSPDPQAETALSLTETLQGISENQYPTDQPDDNDPDGYPDSSPDDTPEVLRRRRIHGRVMSVRWMASVIHHVWNYAAVLRTRLKVSRVLRAVQHSPNLRHAIKNAGGIVLLSLPAFLPTDSPGASIPLVQCSCVDYNRPLFFPRHCRVMFLNNISRTIGIVSQLYLSLSRCAPKASVPPINVLTSVSLGAAISSATL